MHRYLNAAILVLAAPLVAACITINTGDNEDTLTVVGEAIVLVPPEYAELSVAVNTEGTTPVEALRANSTLMYAVREAIGDYGITEQNIRTSDITVREAEPEYDREGIPTGDERGHFVSNDVRIRIDDLGAIERIIGALVAAGANQVRDVTFEVNNPAQYMERARDEAIADARRRAAAMSTAAGVVLGPIIDVSLGGNALSGGGVTEVLISGSLIAGAPSVPVSPTPREFRTTVTLVYEIQRQ